MRANVRSFFLLLFFSLSTAVLGSDVILFAAFQNRADAVQTARIVQKILRKRHPGHRVYIRNVSGHYRVVSDPISDERERQSILHDVQHSVDIAHHQAPRKTSGTFSGTASSSAGYNNNIYDHTCIETTDYNHYTIDNNTTIVSDFFIQNRAQLHYRYLAKNPALSWNSTLGYYGKRYRKHPNLNLRQVTLESGLEYAFAKNDLSFPFFFKRIWYGGSGYLHLYGAAPRFTHALNKNTAFVLEINAFKKRFIKTDKRDWNSNHLDAGVGFEIFSHSHATLGGKVGAVAERRTQGKRTDVSYTGAFFAGTFILPLRGRTYADLGFRIDRRFYLHKHPNLALRKDTRFRLNLGIVQPLFENISAKINYTHTKNISTINAYTHKSDTITAGISAYF
jgi:hypothetical protein